MKGNYQVEDPQHNKTISSDTKSLKPVDMQEVNNALAALRKHVSSAFGLMEKEIQDFYSTDVEVIRFVDKEIMKKVIELNQNISSIIVYSKNLIAMHEKQGRLFYD